MPAQPTQEQAEKAWKHMNKGKKYYDAMTPEQKKAAWQFGYDRKLVDISKLGPGAKAEYQRYVNPNKPEYAMQASIVEAKPKQYIQTQNEKVIQAITPNALTGLINKTPEQISAIKSISGRQLEDMGGNIRKPQPMQQQLPINTNIRGKAVVQQGKIANPNLVRPDNPAAPFLVNAVNTASLGLLERNTDAIDTLRDKSPVASTVGSMAGYLAPFGAAKGALVKGTQTLGKRLLTDAGVGIGVDVATEAVRGKETLAQTAGNVGKNAVIGIAADLALSALGAAGKAISKKLINKQTLSAAEKAIIDKLPEEAKKEITFYVDQYGNVKDTPNPTLLLGEGKTLTPEITQREAPYTVTKAPLKPEIKQQGINTLPIENKSLKMPLNKSLGNNLAQVSNAAQTAKEAVGKAPGKKDISGFQAYTTDVYRNFEQVFGEDFPAVKKEVLDPFDAAKKAKTVEDRQLMADLKKNIVDKLGINKTTPDSALVQQFGEKRLSLESLVAKVGKTKADKIVEADKYFRETYDRLINEVNTARAIVYPNNPEKLIPKRKDYYRHFKELSDDFAGLKNIFETPSQISPSLAGTSEFTKPKSKFLSFAQKRGNGEFTDDAVGGFLDYINAATYAKHIDTQIPKFRGLAADLAESTEQSKNMNNFIGYLTDFANDLSGKTNPADRFVQKIIPGGRMTFKALNWLNSRVKANTVLGNVSSSLSQLANLPQGIAYVKNPVYISKGAGNFMASIFGKGDAELYKKSGFLLERYADSVARQFDTKLLDQPKKAAAWMLGAMDEIGTKTIWSSVYQKALADGIADPIKHADDVTRKLVAGRGIGEVPLLQKSKVMQLVAPFTLEVNNLWKVQKDFVKAKDFGALAMLYLANFALNKGMEEVRGSGVVFDPIDALVEAISEFAESDADLKSQIDSKQAKYDIIANKNREEAKDLKKEIDELKSTVKTLLQKAGLAAGRLGGEVLSNMPLGSTLATLYPEYGISNDFIDLPTREKLFGRNDPTRFGGGLLAVKGLQDPLYKLAPSFGGGQIKKTVQAGQDLGILPKLKKEDGKITLKKQDLPASYSNTKQGDRLRTTIDAKPSTIAKGLAFGRGAIPELKKYYESGKVPLGTTQTANIKKLVDKGYEPNKLFETLNGIRGTNKKADIVVKLRESGYNSKQIDEIWEIFYK